MDFLILTISLIVLIISADKLTDSSAKIAKYYGVPVFIIGVSIIAFGTSAPELIVAIVSSINKVNDISLGNIIGSCINNTGIIIAISAFILTIKVDERILKREMLILTLVETILIIMLANNVLGRIEGIILLILGILFIIYIIKHSENPKQKYKEDEYIINKKEVPKNWFKIVFSLIGLIVGGQLIVNSSTAIATKMGIETTVIGLTLIAIGTTMPELVTSISAARRKEDDLILGNVIGSNIFNILIILGIASIIKPINIVFYNKINIMKSMFIDLGFMYLLNIYIYIVMLRRKKISAFTGSIVLVLYVLYLFTTKLA